MRAYIAVILMFFSFIASAQFIDGNELKRVSESKERVSQRAAIEGDYQDSAHFTGYIQAAFDANINFLCQPTSFSTKQLAAVVTRYLKDNPQNWHFSGDKLVILAVSEAFPCPAEKVNWSKFKPLKK